MDNIKLKCLFFHKHVNVLVTSLRYNVYNLKKERFISDHSIGDSIHVWQAPSRIAIVEEHSEVKLLTHGGQEVEPEEMRKNNNAHL